MTDAETKLVSLFETFDIISVHETDGVAAELARARAEGHKGLRIPTEASFVTWWFRTKENKSETATARVSLFGPEGQLLERWPFEVKLEDASNTRYTLKMKALPFIGFGRYLFVTELLARSGRWEREARHPFEFRPAPPSGTGSSARASADEQSG